MMRDLVILSILVLFTSFALAVADLAEFALRTSNPEKDLIFEVERGSNFRAILKKLREAGVVNRPAHWLVLAKLRGDDSRIQAGVYALSTADSPWQVLNRITRGQSLEFSLTIPEGWTALEMLKAVQAHPYIKATLPLDDPAQWMSAVGASHDHPEGWFFPDTYRFKAGSTDVEFLKRSHQKMTSVLAKAWMGRAENLPIDTPYEALILASIVEKESAKPSERPLIAGVFTQRLRRGMRLETDPTVIYGIGARYDGNIRRRDLRTDTPYNTYTRAGLPPTPIALPGAEAIRAAVRPAKTDALFFVSRGDGSHVFSRSYAAHRRAVIKHQLAGKAQNYPAER